MSSHIVIDGNAFYEVDDACMHEKGEGKRKAAEKQGKEKWGRKRREAAAVQKWGLTVRRSPEKCVIVFLAWRQILA